MNKSNVVIVSLLILVLLIPIVPLIPGYAEDPKPIGYKIVGDIVEIWNPDTTYYFNKTSGIQWTEDPEQYWTRNIFAVGYYSGGEWHKIYSADELGSFNREIESDYATYVNATLWKDFTYSGHELRLGIRYHLKLDDTDLSVIIYAKNLGEEDFPMPLGVAWMVTEIDIPNPLGEDTVFINGTDYRLDGVYDLTFKNINAHYRIFDYTEFITLEWDENVDYTVKLKCNGVQEEATITWMVNAGIFKAGQEKSTTLFWADAIGDYTGIHFDIGAKSGDPNGMTSDGINIWVSDWGDTQVYKYTLAGSYVTSWDTSAHGASLEGLTTDSVNIDTIEDSTDEVYKWTMAGVYVSSWDTSGECNWPTDICTDGTHIWVVDSSADQVYKYQMDGTYTTENWDTGTADSPYGITTDGNWIWINDETDKEVYQYNMAGAYQGKWSYAGQTASYSHGVCTDGVYVWIAAKATDCEVYKYEAITLNEPPNAPTLTSPANDASYDIGESVSFSWTFSDPNGGDTQGAYRIQIDNDSGFGSPEVDSNKVVSSSESTSRNLPSTVDKYYWRVKTWDDSDEEGPWSSARYVIANCVELVSVAFDDSRLNIGGTAEVRYVLRYAYDSVSFTGSDGSIVGYSWDGANSWWDKAVTAPASPEADNYDENDLGALTDNNYGLTVYEDDAGVNLVGDRYNVTDFWASNYNPLIDSNITLYAKFESEYDSHICGADDSITIEGLSFTYHPIEEYFFATVGKNESGTYYFDTLNSIYEDTYNVTSGNMDFIMSITWNDYVIELFGLYYENGTFAGDVNVTAVTDLGAEEYNVNGNLTIYTSNQIRFLFWDLPGGGVRRLYPKDNNETFYLFTPHDTYSSYSLEVVDYIGAIGFQDSYLEMYGLVNTTTYLIERYLIWDSESTSPLTAMTDKIYSLQIRLPIDNIYSFGYWVPTTSTPPVLTLSILDPDNYYQPISGIVNIEATRPDANHIKVIYEDTRDLTLSVLVNITLRNGTMVYNVTGSSALDVFNWYEAVNTTEYVVYVTVDHSYYGEITYSTTLIGAMAKVDPPSWEAIGIQDEWIWLGLVVVVAGTVSKVNAAVGLFAGACVASTFSYMGLLEVQYELLAGAFIISILMGLNRK